MKNYDIKNNYILNKNYMLKYDKKRFIITNRHSHDIYLDRNAEDFPESVNTIMHPLLALLFSLFNGYRSKEDIIVEYSEILKISTDVVKKFVDDLVIEVLEEKEKKFIKFENRLFYIPHNLFLKNKDGKYLNGILDKLCWVVWAEGRTQNEYKAIETPIGYIPLYSDLKLLFKQYLNKEYKEADYIKQFSIRTKKLLEKLERIESMYKKERDVPKIFWEMLIDQRKSLITLRNKYNMEEISPLLLKKL